MRATTFRESSRTDANRTLRRAAVQALENPGESLGQSAPRPPLIPLPDLFLDVLLDGSYLYIIVLDAGLVGRLWEYGRAVQSRAGAEVEARAVPGTDDGVALPASLLQRPREVVTRGGDSAKPRRSASGL